MKEINPYAPPLTNSLSEEHDHKLDLELQFVVDERLLIDAEAEEKRVPMTKYVMPFLIFCSLLTLVGIGLSHLLPEFGLNEYLAAMLSYLPFIIALLSWVLFDRACRRSFQIAAEKDVRALQQRFPNLQFGIWDVRVSSKQLAVSTPEQDFLWNLAQLQQYSIPTPLPRLKGSLFIRTPEFVLPIPTDATCGDSLDETLRVLRLRIPKAPAGP